VEIRIYEITMAKELIHEGLSLCHIWLAKRHKGHLVNQACEITAWKFRESLAPCDRVCYSLRSFWRISGLYLHTARNICISRIKFASCICWNQELNIQWELSATAVGSRTFSFQALSSNVFGSNLWKLLLRPQRYGPLKTANHGIICANHLPHKLGL